MIDLERMRRIRLFRRPPGQIIVGNLGLRWDYRFPKKTRIVLEGTENIPPDRGVFLAMNHTDRYNYWPFQYAMYRHGGLRFTATWVKGKYYENRWLGAFMDVTNNIPLPSRGYVVATDFRKAVGRVPNRDEYRILRDLVDGKLAVEEAIDKGGTDVARWLSAAGAGGPEAVLDGFEGRFAELMRHVERLTSEALTKYQCNVLVFPQGTRSKRLSKGHTGLMQMAQRLGVDIIPVGSNGSNRAYPGSSPFSKGGDLVYRIGKPLSIDGPELAGFRITEDFTPFLPVTTKTWREPLQSATDVVMDQINALLDPEYQYAEDLGSDGVDGIHRFF